MILAKTSILVVAIPVICYFTFIAAIIVIMYHGIKLKRYVLKYWEEKGVKAGLFFFWNQDRWLIDDPEYHKIKNKTDKIGLTCVIIAFLSGIGFFLTVAFMAKG